MPARLRPTALIAPDALLVGDPGRALMLAQELLQQPKMSNHARGLWGYSGVTEAGDRLTVQATGMGGPSASVVLTDLAELGVRRAIRIGTCTALGDLALGELMIVTEAEQSRCFQVMPDPTLTKMLAAQLGEGARGGRAISLDLLHRHHVESKLPGDAADMQTATLLRRGEELNVAVAAVLIVTEAHDHQSLDDEAEAKAAKMAGEAAATVLSP